MALSSQPFALSVSNLGPIAKAKIVFGDLTVLVGPQASGKSVLLQTLKLLLDKVPIASTLRRQAFSWTNADGFLELYFGEGMSALWSSKTRLVWQGKGVAKDSLLLPKTPRDDARASLFYIPAHRALTLQNGWPRHFGDYKLGDPYVVADFSEQLRKLMEAGLGRTKAMFPRTRLSKTTRLLLKQGIFGEFELLQELNGAQRRWVLKRPGQESLPFMVWSTGQREFSPLLLGLYPFFRAEGVSRGGIKWIVLEEPEMGLHPRATTAVLFLVLELLHRGYRVCVSTHSTHVLELIWALRVLIEREAPPEVLLRLFDVVSSAKNKEMAAQVLKKSLKVYSFNREGEPVVDISRLDPASSSPEEISWGGLNSFTARTSDVVADFIANQARSSSHSKAKV